MADGVTTHEIKDRHDIFIESKEAQVKETVSNRPGVSRAN